MGMLATLYDECLRKGIITGKDNRDTSEEKLREYAKSQGFDYDKLVKIQELEGKMINYQSLIELGIGDPGKNYRKLEKLSKELLKI